MKWIRSWRDAMRTSLSTRSPVRGRVNAHSCAQMDPRAEQALIARAKSGDRAAFESLLEPTVRAATRLAFAMILDRTEAEDVFQEAALRAWRKLPNLREDKPFQPWFIGIVANQCRDVRRGRWWKLVRIPNLDELRSGDETSWLEAEDLRRAIAALPHDQRVTVLPHFHLDMPLVEVAAAQGISVAGVKMRIKRALRRLRPALGVAEVPANG